MIPALLFLTLLPVGDADAGGNTLPNQSDMETGTAALTFQFTSCPENLAREVEELVRADVSWAPGDPPAALTVRCDDTGVTLRLAGDATEVAERKLELVTTPPQARARAAALVATELILMDRKAVPPVLPAARPTALLEAAEPAAPTIAAPEDDERQQHPGRAAAARHTALLAVLGTSLQRAAGDVPMFEGGARVRFPLPLALEVAVDAQALYQRRTSMLGTSQVLGGELSVLAEARAGFAGGAARAGLGVRAVGLRLAGSDVAGAEVRASSAWGAAVGPVMRLAVSTEGRHGVGELAVAGGWCGPAVVGTAAGGSPVGVGGWWVGVTLAAGWLFD